MYQKYIVRCSVFPVSFVEIKTLAKDVCFSSQAS